MKKYVHIYLDEEYLKKLKRLSLEEDTSMSKIIEGLLKNRK